MDKTMDDKFMFIPNYIKQLKLLVKKFNSIKHNQIKAKLWGPVHFSAPLEYKRQFEIRNRQNILMF